MMISSFLISGIAIAAQKMGFLMGYLLLEAALGFALCLILNKSLDAIKWPPAE